MRRHLNKFAGLTRYSATPAGGAPSGGRGRTPIHACIAIAAALVAAPAVAQDRDLREVLVLPSGRAAEFQEMRLERGEGTDTYRFRFVAAQLADTLDDLETLSADLDWLCAQVALPALPVELPDPERIIVSVSAAPTQFGVAQPEIAQVFESYSVEGEACIWEAF